MDPARDEKPHTLIAIETTGDFNEVSAEVGMVARRVKIPDPPLDVAAITGRGGFEDYFLKKSPPFYRRRFLGFF